MPRRILIVDDSSHVRKAVRLLFDGEKEFEICGEATNGHEAIEKAEQLDPDLILLDLSMPVMNGLDAARILRRTKPAVRIVLFTMYSSSFVEFEASKVGICAVVSKADLDDLVELVRSIFRGEGRP
jgi:DNA-binding NarL/FixJ family response regulator